MYRDIVDLREFYAGRLGQVTRRMIRRRIRQWWPNLPGRRVLGVGFATPYLRPFLDEGASVIAAMPAQQGVIFWPGEGPGRTVLVEDDRLPFADAEFDHVLLVHGLESCLDIATLLSEIWRVMSGDGRLLAIVPNRTGLWARLERTPFGHGVPFTGGQLRRTLKDHQFIPERLAHGLFFPPSEQRVILASGGWLEHVGERWLPMVGGVHLVEASKQLYALTPTTERAALRRPFIVPMPAKTA